MKRQISQELYRGLTALAVLVGLGSPTARAQLSQGGAPPSWGKGLVLDVPVMELPDVDVARLEAEDDQRDAAGGGAFRFGAMLPVSLDNSRDGSWHELGDGSRVWTLELRSPGALALSFLFEAYDLPPGARLFIHNPDSSICQGAFTEANNREDGSFATSPLAGSRAVLEYHEPAGAASRGALRVSHVVHAYRDVLGAAKGFGDSGACNLDLACSGYSPEVASSVVLVTMGGHAATGVLLNNTAVDGTPYLMTAWHGYRDSGVDPSSWVFTFNHAAARCGDWWEPARSQTLSGARMRAWRPDTGENLDYCLVELRDRIPLAFDVRFAGWEREEDEVSDVAVVHHPMADVKKVSTLDSESIQHLDWSPDSNDENHWLVEEFDRGTLEPGSSGAPLFNSSGRVIGHAVSGQWGCGLLGPFRFPKFSRCWDEGLSEFLDPLGTNPERLAGAKHKLVGPLLVCSGYQRFSLETPYDGFEVLSWTSSANIELDMGCWSQKAQNPAGDPARVLSAFVCARAKVGTRHGQGWVEVTFGQRDGFAVTKRVEVEVGYPEEVSGYLLPGYIDYAFGGEPTPVVYSNIIPEGATWEWTFWDRALMSAREGVTALGEPALFVGALAGIPSFGDMVPAADGYYHSPVRFMVESSCGTSTGQTIVRINTNVKSTTKR